MVKCVEEKEIGSVCSTRKIRPDIDTSRRDYYTWRIGKRGGNVAGRKCDSWRGRYEKRIFGGDSIRFHSPDILLLN